MKKKNDVQRENRLSRLDGAPLSIISLLISIVISAVILAVSGYNPFEAYSAIIAGAFGSLRGIAQTLTQATPLIFTGLAFTLAKKANLINLGVEGQLYMGVLGAAIVGTVDLHLPMVIHLPLAILGGLILGALFGALIGFLKVKFGSNEVVAGVMLNTIATLFVRYLLHGPTLAEGRSVAQTERVVESARLPRIFQSYQLTIAIIIAVIACILVRWFINRTTLGYEIRCVGLNPKAAETAGISIGKHEDKMGYRTSCTNDVVFEDVRIPLKNMIGEEGQGMDIVKRSLGYTRPTSGAGAVGNAQYAYECAVEYSKMRETFGKPICKNQGISFMIADMYTKLEAARQMVWHACKCADAGITDTRLASAAKVFASDIGMQVCTGAVQILGGNGYGGEFPVEKRFRDAKIYQIFEGTNQIQRKIIAGDILYT